ncbi:MAG: hypothetical protein HY939_01575 [Gammaproteobacteria bacterium]|nr:hypothetical protein [Gammaproteobacteria bacterium]
MANLSIRKLDDGAYKQLHLRAVKHGVSMEEEARRIICQAVATPENIGAVFQKHFGPKNGIDLKKTNEKKPHSPMEFDK